MWIGTDWILICILKKRLKVKWKFSKSNKLLSFCDNYFILFEVYFELFRSYIYGSILLYLIFCPFYTEFKADDAVKIIFWLYDLLITIPSFKMNIVLLWRNCQSTKENVLKIQSVSVIYFSYNSCQKSGKFSKYIYDPPFLISV